MVVEEEGKCPCQAFNVEGFQMGENGFDVLNNTLSENIVPTCAGH